MAQGCTAERLGPLPVMAMAWVPCNTSEVIEAGIRYQMPQVKKLPPEFLRLPAKPARMIFSYA